MPSYAYQKPTYRYFEQDGWILRFSWNDAADIAHITERHLTTVDDAFEIWLDQNATERVDERDGDGNPRAWVVTSRTTLPGWTLKYFWAKASDPPVAHILWVNQAGSARRTFGD